MPNPQRRFHLWTRRTVAKRPSATTIPNTVPTTEVIFLIMRRLRAPLIVVVTTFSFCGAGMMLMPGLDAEGNPYRLNIFDASYQMTITLTAESRLDPHRDRTHRPGGPGPDSHPGVLELRRTHAHPR